MLAAPAILNGNHVLCGAETGACMSIYIHALVCVYTCGSVYVCVHLCVSSISHSIVGSGKTLAYLAPVMHQLKDEEEMIGMMARVNRPRAIILCPSRELASQVLVSVLTIIINNM